MTNNKPRARNWNDVQVVIATISMVATLFYWNLFAGPDRASALELAKEKSKPVPSPTTDPVNVDAATPQPDKIFFGGAAPQQDIVVQQTSNNKKNTNNRGGSVAAPPPASSGGGTGGS